MLKQQLIKRKRQQGLSLIEVVVTLFIMSVGLLGLSSLQSTAVKSGLDVAKRSQVTWLVTELAERIRANTEDTTGIAVYPLTLTAADCPALGSTVVGNCIAGNPCNANAMAFRDIVEVFCGPAVGDGVTRHASDDLNLTQVSVDCGGVCTRTSDITIAMSWESLAVNSSETLEEAGQVANQQVRTISMTVRP